MQDIFGGAMRFAQWQNAPTVVGDRRLIPSPAGITLRPIRCPRAGHGPDARAVEPACPPPCLVRTQGPEPAQSFAPAPGSPASQAASAASTPAPGGLAWPKRRSTTSSAARQVITLSLRQP